LGARFPRHPTGFWKSARPRLPASLVAEADDGTHRLRGPTGRPSGHGIKAVALFF
jgi:hypothetical protein